MGTVSIKGLNKAELLLALFHGATFQEGLRPIMGHLEHLELTIEQAEGIVMRTLQRGDDLYFDYIRGRVIKTDLAGDDMSTELYDRDNGGEGAAARVVESLRKKKAGT